MPATQTDTNIGAVLTKRAHLSPSTDGYVDADSGVTHSFAQ